MNFGEPSIDNVILWLYHGRPSDYVIVKEGLQHFENPRSLSPEKINFDLLTICRVAFPNGADDIRGKDNLFYLIVQKLEALK